MQHDLEYDLSSGLSHNANEVQEGLTLEPPPRELPLAQRRPRFSPTAWRHILILGDEILFLTLLALVLTLTPHLDLELRVSSHEQNLWYLKILWGFLAVISWNVTVRITEAHRIGQCIKPIEEPAPRTLCTCADAHILDSTHVSYNRQRNYLLQGCAVLSAIGCSDLDCLEGNLC